MRYFPVGCAAVLACTVPAQDLTTLRSFYGFGDASALAVDAAETTAYVGESAAVSIVDLTTPGVPLPPSATIARVGVDAAVISLLLDETQQRLLIAGGSFGLVSMDVSTSAHAQTVVEDLGDLVCFEAALTASHVVAVFGADGASMLRVYDRATLAPVGSVALGAGSAFAVAIDGVFAYVAMGSGGLTRVDLSNPAAPVAAAGPVFPIGVFGDHGRARDVVVANGRVYAAVDDLGLVSMRTSAPWGPSIAYTSIAISGAVQGGGSAPLYAHRVAASGSFVYVGANNKAGREVDGGPFTSFGPMDYKLAVGGVVTPEPLAQSDALVVFQNGASGLVLAQQVAVTSPWRELIARPTLVYGEHAFSGLFVRSAAAAGTVVSSHRGLVYQPAEAIVSLRDPDITLCGQDGAGDAYVGLLDIGDPDAITPVPNTAPLGSFGLWFDAQWLDTNPTREWFVANGADDWRMYRFDVANPPAVASWLVTSPNDPVGGGNGRNYFLSWLDGDLLLLTRGGTRYGLVGYSRSALEAAAASTPAGQPLATPPLWQLETHFLPEANNSLTWRCRTFTLPGGQRVAAIAAAYNTSHGGMATHPQIVLYDVSSGTAGVPTLLAVVNGPNTQGNAVAVAPVRVGSTTYLFVVDFGYGLHVFDVSVPTAPVLVGGWASPPNVFDGRIDHPTDLELEATAGGGLTAYVTLWRRGIVALDVSNPASFAFTQLAEVDTPGLPYGIAIRDVDGSRGLLLADHQAGLRLYGHYAKWQSLGGGCDGAAPAPVLSVVHAPVLGGTFELAVSGLTGGAAYMVLGYAQAITPLQPLGYGFGANCSLYETTDQVDVLTQSAGAAAWTMVVPPSPSLQGMHVYNQAVELTAMSTASNGGDGVID